MHSCISVIGFLKNHISGIFRARHVTFVLLCYFWVNLFHFPMNNSVLILRFGVLTHLQVLFLNLETVHAMAHLSDFGPQHLTVVLASALHSVIQRRKKKKRNLSKVHCLQHLLFHFVVSENALEETLPSLGWMEHEFALLAGIIDSPRTRQGYKEQCRNTSGFSGVALCITQCQSYTGSQQRWMGGAALSSQKLSRAVQRTSSQHTP